MSGTLFTPSNGLLSLIIPVYNTAKYLPRCLESALAQTYRNMEIICVDDASPDNSHEILQSYAQKDSRVKIVRLEKNGGPFHARLHGTEHSTGTYIAFLDSDDYVSVDFYRSLIFDMERHGADMALGDTLEERDGEKYIFNLAESNLNFGVLEGEEIKKRYFEQEGSGYFWHVVWNKVISRELYNRAKPYYERQEKHLIMLDDIIFSTVLYTQAKKIVKTNNCVVSYCRHKDSATHTDSYKKFKKNIDDVANVFSFVDKYMEETGVSEAYKSSFFNWMAHIRDYYIGIAERRQWLSDDNLKILSSISSMNKKMNRGAYIYSYSVQTKWDSRYEELKRRIADPSIEVVSFDVFDTLLLRPFFTPTDLFYLLDDCFKKLMNGTFTDFSLIRPQAEQLAGEKMRALNSAFQDITLDEIYKALETEYHVSGVVAAKMKAMELETELRFCQTRNSAFALYELALYLGKRVICVSDMYLPKAFIEEMLKKCGYGKIEKVFVSSETRLKKGSGAMYEHLLKDLHIKGDNILHIGDNYNSDVVSARKAGLKAAHLMKTIDAYKQSGKGYHTLASNYHGEKPATWCWSIRTMAALAANRYFDNPFRSFDQQSDYNIDPAFMGYSALGMHLFGVTQWLIENFQEKKYDTAVFFARDGYLPMNAFKILKDLYPDMPNEKYLPTSRQAMLSISVQTESDIYMLCETILAKSPLTVIPFLNQIFDIDELKVKDICETHGFALDVKFKSNAHFNSFIKICADRFFDMERHAAKNERIKKYLQTFFEGNTCAVDVGFSAKQSMYISKLLKPIDTYFLYTRYNTYKHVRAGNFNLYTYRNDVSYINLIEERFISDLSPSCIGYDVSGGDCVPIYKEDILLYAQTFAIQKMQDAALSFIRDMKELFGEYMKLFTSPRYYHDILLRDIWNNPKTLDQKMFAHVIADSDLTDTAPLVKSWNDVVRTKPALPAPPSLPSLLKKIAYHYAMGGLKDKVKNGVKRKLSGHKILLDIATFAYRAARKVKRML